VASIRFDGVSKVFGSVRAVDGLSLAAGDGEFLVLVGPSGSGKTTALRVLAGLEGMSAGKIWIGDRDVTQLRPQDRDIAMVFQDYALYPQMSVEKNMSFALRNSGTNRSVIRQRVHDAAGRLGLEELLQRKPSELSGGQRQRVALGRAIVREPAVFLMDEPLSNLDANLRVQMRAEIKRLQRELGTTTIYVTHDQVEAMTMGDRIAIMRDGRLRQVASPTVVYRRPADRFVASFIGSPAMSFAAMHVVREPGRVVLRRQSIQLVIGSPPATLPEEVLMGVRPEDAVLWDNDRELLGPIAGEIAYVEDLGREWFAGTTVDGEASFVIGGATTRAPEIGDQVRFGIRPAGVYLFDPESELCLDHPDARVADGGHLVASLEDT
jgi:ABC-type sugar transport system ATPase subunit